MLNEIDLSRADLNLLVLFSIVLEERHVGRAAERLHLSPSAVSHGLGRLRRLLHDPLFLRTPKGVVPTARATELAAPIADILARVRAVVGTAEPFDAATSARRFTIAAPDAVAAALLPALLADLRGGAPRVAISLRQLLPTSERPTIAAWESILDDLDARAFDIAIAPLAEVPARFVARTLYEEEFVIAMRAEHPFIKAPSLDRFCEAAHLLVSLTGDPFGLVDDALAREGLSRRVALTVPNFMMALAVVAETDMLAALPRRLVAKQAGRFGLISVEAPLRLPRYQIQAITPKAAMKDAGLAWLFDTLGGAAQEA